MNELALFAGAGGGILAGKLLGWKTVCAVEIEPYAASVLIQRQNEGFLQTFPIWDNVCTFDGKPWCGIVDVVSGGFPCQDISVAGKKKGLKGKRSGLWKEMSRIISEVQPRYAFIENVSALIVRGLSEVLCDLAQMGYNANWGCLSASDIGLPHKRERIWIVAYNYKDKHNRKRTSWQKDKSAKIRMVKKNYKKRNCGFNELGSIYDFEKCNSYSEGCRIIDEMADRMDRLAAIGNGQVPGVAALAWEVLKPGE